MIYFYLKNILFENVVDYSYVMKQKRLNKNKYLKTVFAVFE